MGFRPAGGGGATTFTSLTDTPGSYAGEATKIVRVNAAATGLEFVTASGAAPTWQDVTDNGNTTTNALIYTPSALQSLTAGTAILANASTARIEGSGGAVTITATPTIANGTDGQILMIRGTSDTNLVTIQDEGALAGSNLQLSTGVNFTFGIGDTLVLMFDADAGDWIEISRSGN